MGWYAVSIFRCQIEADLLNPKLKQTKKTKSEKETGTGRTGPVYFLSTKTNRTSRFSCLEYPHMHRFSDSAVSGVRRCLANSGSDDVAFSLTGLDRHTEMLPCYRLKGRSSMAGLRCPSHGRSRHNVAPVRPSPEGRSDRLNLLRKKLSFSIPNRFIPAHPCPRFLALKQPMFLFNFPSFFFPFVYSPPLGSTAAPITDFIIAMRVVRVRRSGSWYNCRHSFSKCSNLRSDSLVKS